MKIGIISDTHDHHVNVLKAIEIFNNERVEYVFHAGDIVSPFTAKAFGNVKNAKFIAVFGNNDGDHELLRKKFSEQDRLEIRGNFADVAADGLRIVLLHGSDMELMKALIDSVSFDVVVHGHSHRAETYRKGKTLIVNPGEVCGYLTGKSTIAVFDTNTRQARILEL